MYSLFCFVHVHVHYYQCGMISSSSLCFMFFVFSSYCLSLFIVFQSEFKQFMLDPPQPPVEHMTLSHVFSSSSSSSSSSTHPNISRSYSTSVSSSSRISPVLPSKMSVTKGTCTCTIHVLCM